MRHFIEKNISLHLAIDVANIYMLNIIIFHLINEIIEFDLLLYYCVHETLIECFLIASLLLLSQEFLTQVSARNGITREYGNYCM